MKNFLSVENLSVLSKNDLCIFGKITDLIFDESLKKIAYFLCINEDEKFALPYECILTFGDAVTVENQVEKRSLLDLDFTTHKTIIGKEVYSDNGTKVGIITDVVFDSTGNTYQILAGAQAVKVGDIQGIGDLILLKPTPKRRRKTKKVDFSTLAQEDNPVNIMSNNHDETDKATTENIVSFETDADEAVSLKTKVDFAEKHDEQTKHNGHSPISHIPPRVISDYNFLLGRTLTENLYNYNGELLAFAGSYVNIEMVESARLHGKLLELTLNSK